jgi:hypothetical protein
MSIELQQIDQVPGPNRSRKRNVKLVLLDEGSYITGTELFVDGGFAQV